MEAAATSETSRTILPRRHELPWRPAQRALANRRFLLLLGFAAATSIFTPLFAKMTVHYANAWLGDPALATPLLLTYALSQIAAQPLWTALANRWEKRSAAIAAQGLVAVAVSLFAFTAPTTLPLAVLAYGLCGAATGGVYMISWAMLPDTIDQATHGAPHNDEAFDTGIFLLVLKIASGLGMGLAASGLALIAYDPAVATGARLSGILNVMWLGPLLGVLLALVFLWPLRLRHRSITGGEARF
jgi:Na+/melibiose symporter-like transporter